ncbi:MAG: glycoside hydrolase family 2 [Clostridia bacterium]|nr:glycoside hydrolase family 2 [Clostridia bacterium]
MKKKNNTVFLTTPEAENASLPVVYPRPCLVRDSFFSLDGKWEFCAHPKGHPPKFDRRIRVPFPPESPLSRVGEVFPDGTELNYRKSFTLPEGFCRDRVILHFGAADQVAEVWLNSHFLGKHVGGYHPFSFEITEHLREGSNHLYVRVTDRLNDHVLPWGKQRHDRGGMWYTPISGIWQSVWLESVPAEYVRSLTVKANGSGALITAEGVSEGMIKVYTENGFMMEKMRDGKVEIKLQSPHLWSPEDPYLYRFTLMAGEDSVNSYFACRTLSVGEHKGVKRLMLNGKPYFFHGLLDQGYFSDGIYTPAHPSRYEKDILLAKSLGFNMLRKHIKIEPQQFYYDCDRLGMVVFQDMVNNGHYSFFRDTALPTLGIKRRNDKKLHTDPDTRAAFLSAMEETVKLLSNHPSICYWTIFNEGWGQFEGDAAYGRMKELDDTRWIDTASGWFIPRESDVDSPHVYFKPVKCRPEEKPLVLSEFGGYSLPIVGHVFNPNKVYGYRKFEDEGQFREAVLRLYREEILPAAKAGLSGAVYTQLTDVEDEINGLVTYDRKHVKVDPAEMRALAEELCHAQDSYGGCP